MVLWNNYKIADAGFLLNLESRTDRLETSVNHLKELNIEGVERYNAFKFPDESSFKLLGCAQSHIDIMKIQLEKKFNKVVIFEDDFIFDDLDLNISPLVISEKLSKVLDYLEFDILFLGTTLLDRVKFSNDDILVPSKIIQTTCYIVDINLAKYVVENYDFQNTESLTYGENIDTFYSIISSKDHWKSERDLFDRDIFLNNDKKVFCFNPIIFNQRDSFSDISGRRANNFARNRMLNSRNANFVFQ